MRESKLVRPGTLVTNPTTSSSSSSSISASKPTQKKGSTSTSSRAKNGVSSTVPSSPPAHGASSSTHTSSSSSAHHVSSSVTSKPSTSVAPEVLGYSALRKAYNALIEKDRELEEKCSRIAEEYEDEKNSLIEQNTSLQKLCTSKETEYQSALQELASVKEQLTKVEEESVIQFSNLQTKYVLLQDSLEKNAVDIVSLRQLTSTDAGMDPSSLERRNNETHETQQMLEEWMRVVQECNDKLQARSSNFLSWKQRILDPVLVEIRTS